ncbi:hypothetical protein, partial [Klebsiella pneumoniae]|uniref:hypothetical protein n=1 Tax=Klebsiella pneumoniae TaxID=573 RepID=UPI001C575F5E
MSGILSGGAALAGPTKGANPLAADLPNPGPVMTLATRTVTLPGGLQATLVHQPQADRAAAL